MAVQVDQDERLQSVVVDYEAVIEKVSHPLTTLTGWYVCLYICSDLLLLSLGWGGYWLGDRGAGRSGMGVGGGVRTCWYNGRYIILLWLLTPLFLSCGIKYYCYFSLGYTSHHSPDSPEEHLSPRSVRGGQWWNPTWRCSRGHWTRWLSYVAIIKNKSSA